MNNALTGGLSGLLGGWFGNMVAGAGSKVIGTSFLFDVGIDAVLLGADPVFQNNNKVSAHNKKRINFGSPMDNNPTYTQKGSCN